MRTPALVIGHAPSIEAAVGLQAGLRPAGSSNDQDAPGLNVVVTSREEGWVYRGPSAIPHET